MALEQKDYKKIEAFMEDFLRENAGRILSEKSFVRPPQVYENELRERTVRVEEDLKNQRKFMKQDLEHIEKRFEHIERRIELIKKWQDDYYSNRMLHFMIWSFGLTVAAAGVIIAFMRMQ